MKMYWYTFLVIIITAESRASRSGSALKWCYANGDSRSGLERCYVNDSSCAAQLKVSTQKVFSKSSCTVKNVPDCMNQDLGSPGGDPSIGSVSVNPVQEACHPGSLHDSLITVINLTFTNIKWNSLKFRFKNKELTSHDHCREFELAEEVLSERTVSFQYDCKWQWSELFNKTYQLEYEAKNPNGSKRGRIHFIVPYPSTLDWRPFLSVEEDESSLTLHIQPPKNINVTEYVIASFELLDNDMRRNISGDLIVASDGRQAKLPYKLSGSYVFTVLPNSPSCLNDACKLVQSAVVVVINDRRIICIVSILAVVVSCLFACYLLMKFIRKYWLTGSQTTYKPPPNPKQVLIVHENTHKLHQECVDSLVNYLREDLQLEVYYEGDVINTDPTLWAQNVFDRCDNIIVLANPKTGKILTPHLELRANLLKLIREYKSTNNYKKIVNVVFDYSDAKTIPRETEKDPVYIVPRDWNKLIAFLTDEPRKNLEFSEKSHIFMENLRRTKEELENKKIVQII